MVWKTFCRYLSQTYMYKIHADAQYVQADIYTFFLVREWDDSKAYHAIYFFKAKDKITRNLFVCLLLAIFSQV